MNAVSMRKLRNALPKALGGKLPRQIEIVPIREQEARRLNRRYRARRRAANVLSFRYGSDYGEILVCPQVIRRDAASTGNTYSYQLTWMVLHGMIHLAGMHHERSAAMARRVTAIEDAILRRLFDSVNAKRKT